MSNYLVLSHLNVINANAVSSPLSIGVPAVTAFLGASHKLQRYLNANGYPSVKISGTGIVVHDTNLKTYVFKNTFEYTETTRMSGRPLTKEGGRCSTIPDPKIDMDVSLICEVEEGSSDSFDEKDFLAKADEALSKELRVAGGDILPPRLKDGKVVSSYLEAGRVKYFRERDAESNTDLRDIKRFLTPGYVLIERKDLLEKEMKNGRDPVEALVDYLAIHHECTRTEDDEVEWTAKRKTAGWIVPISVGYQGLTEPSKAENQRDNRYPHVFGESLVTLGEFEIINAINDFDKTIWRYDADLEKQKFVCTCNNRRN